MSDGMLTKEFYARADEVIAVANKQVKESDVGAVSSSTLYAAARYNAFNVAAMAESLEEFKGEKDEAIRFFTEQYKKMLVENIDEYIANYDKYNPHL